MTTLRLAIFVATIAAAVWAVVGVEDAPYDPLAMSLVDESEGLLVDAPAREFTLHDLEGNPHSLSDLRGKIVFLNFWASWCPPCVEEMPSMVRMAQALAGRDFVMVAVTVDGEREALADFLRRTRISGREMLVLRDPTAATARAYGTQLYPETYVIDRDGRVVARFLGARQWDSAESLRLVERLLWHDWRS